MTPEDYGYACRFAMHVGCVHWMDDDHFCRGCENVGIVIAVLAERDKARDQRVRAAARAGAFEEAAKAAKSCPGKMPALLAVKFLIAAQSKEAAP